MGTLSIFLSTAGTVDDVHEGLAVVLGRRLAKQDLDVGTVYAGAVLDIELRLFDDHGLEDDGGIPFTDYQHQLDLIPLESSLHIEGYMRMYESVALFLAAKMARMVHGQSIVVANLQRLLASFG